MQLYITAFVEMEYGYARFEFHLGRIELFFLWALALAFFAYILIAPLFGLLAWFKHERIIESRGLEWQQSVNELRKEVWALRRQLVVLRRQLNDGAQIDVPPAHEPTPQPAPDSNLAAMDVPPPNRAKQETELKWNDPRTPPKSVQGQPAQTPPARLNTQIEEKFATQWMVWLGAVTVAIGSIFMVKHSIEQGWLSPVVRVSLGGLFGLVLMAGGEWLRRRPLQRALASVQPNYIPPAITSAGLFASLASCYTAYVLYDLISPLVAFVLMATLALLALGLSILQGPFVALLGLVAGYLTPMLLATGQPMAWGLFPYLLLLTASGMAIVRYMAWRWLAWAVLAGSLLWPSFWTLRVWQVGDTLPIGLYLLVVAGISLYVLAGFVLQDDAAKSSLAEIAAGPELVFWVTATAIALLAIVLVRLDNYQIVSLAILFALAAGYLYFGRWRQRFDLLAVVAAATSVIAIALWHFPSIISVVGPFYEIEGSGHGRAIGPVIPPELQAFLITASIFGTLHAVGGFAAVWGARRSVVWASISAAVPIVLVIVSYWRIADFTVDFTWGFASIFLAGSALAACMRLQKFNASAGLNEALGLYAAAVVAAISLTLTMTLREAWLTVALSVQLPALAWITGRISVRALYYVAWVVATVVVVRLSFNENILDYHLGGWPILNWVLFGYGIPAISFFYAAHEFRNLRQVKLVNLLEVGGLAFTVLLVTFEIRQLMAGSLGGSYEFAEKAVQMTAWLCMAYGLATRSNWRDRWAFRWAWRTLLLMALGHMSILLIDHDWMHSPSVGELVFLNWLIPAFAVPALFSFLFARLFQQRGSPRLAAVAMIIGLVEFLIFISFEVRQFFNGSILWGYINSDLEHYSYSVAWLLYGGALLAIGMWREVAQIRWASLAIVLVTVAKVFLIDMSALSGLYRVASFVGLGLALIGIGYLYQHFVRGKLVTNDPIPRP